MARKATAKRGSGNVFADLGLPNPEQELLKAQLTLQIYRIVKARKLTQAQAGERARHQAAECLGADAQPCRQFFGRAADGIFDRARAGREDYGKPTRKRVGEMEVVAGVAAFCSPHERSEMRAESARSRNSLRSFRATLD